MSNDKYQLCPCGSGKKLKFCCYEKGRTPGQIPDAELFRQAADFRICESHVNPNWQESGLAEVLIVRQTLSLNYIAGVYLVDVFCLGLKNTYVTATFRHADVRSLLSRFSQPMEEVAYEDARSIILGAIEYARQLGFEPHDDWKISGPTVEAERPFRRTFTFGYEGKPFYIQGPDDNAGEIMKKLGPLVEKGEAHFLTDAGDDTSFDDRLEEIEEDLRDGAFEDARSETETLIDEFPGRWEPPYLMGTCLAMQGNPEQAILFLEQSLAICPSSEAYYNLAAAHKSVFQIRSFLTCMEKAIELDGANGEIGAKAKAQIDDLTAMMCKSSGITRDQYVESSGRFEDAFACLSKGRFEDAIRGFNRVLDIQPDHVQSYGNLGLAHAWLGDRDAAIRYLDKAIELDPGYQPAIENRRLVLALRPGETLKSFGMREIDFYADKVRASSL